jgi:hypothetical protein
MMEGDMLAIDRIVAREVFLHFLDLEIKRARRYQNFFSVMRFELCNEGEETRSQPKSSRSLGKLLEGEVRETDVVGQMKKNEFMILLPYCDSLGADVVNKRLKSLIRDFHLGERGLRIKSALISFPVQANDMNEILIRLNGNPRKSPISGMNQA